MRVRSFIGQPLFAMLATTALLAGCSRNDANDDATNPALGSHIARIVPASEILASAHIPTIDPHTMADAHIEKVIGPGPRCAFRYTSSGKPAVGIAREPSEGAAAGVMMLNGDLLALQMAPADSGLVLTADEIRLTLTTGSGQGTTPSPSSLEDATLLFEVGDQMRVGYRGYYGCDGGEGGS